MAKSEGRRFWRKAPFGVGESLLDKMNLIRLGKGKALVCSIGLVRNFSFDFKMCTLISTEALTFLWHACVHCPFICERMDASFEAVCGEKQKERTFVNVRSTFQFTEEGTDWISQTDDGASRYSAVVGDLTLSLFFPCLGLDVVAAIRGE